MWKLICLEWKKNHLGTYIKGAVLLAAALGLFIYALAFLGIANDPDGVLDAAPGGDTISAPIELFTSMAFLIYTSVMLASFIVSAYKNKTMNLMFTYPIKRQNILISQMLSVWLFNAAALLLTRLAIYLGVYWVAQSNESAFAVDFDLGNAAFYLRLILNSVEIVSMSFIALFVGMAWRSSKAVIVTSFLLIFLTQGNVGTFTMADSVVVPVVLTGISAGFAVLTVWNVEKKDLV